MSLRELAERIADTPGWYGSGRERPDGTAQWYHRVPVEGDTAQSGEMTLTEDELVVTDYGWFEMATQDRSGMGSYELPRSQFVRLPSATPGSVRFDRTDRITSSGAPSRLLMHWLGHALIEP